ncbi:hypothetical protein ES705_07560 [subsurface metagenome]
MASKINLKGQKFGRLLVLWDSKERTKCGHIIWLCKCDCGKRVRIIGGNLRNGYSRSCGCLTRERIKILGRGRVKHGESKKSRLYVTWQNMRRKCYNRNAINFKNYGGRGIRICREWFNKKTGYLNFRMWAMANGYAVGLRYYLISRKDCRKHFSPDNCQITSRVGWLEL